MTSANTDHAESSMRRSGKLATPGSAPRRLPRRRLRPIGSSPWDAMGLATAGAALLVIIAGAWLAFVALRPLPTPPAASSIEIPPLPGGRGGPRPIDARQRDLASLGRLNLFAADRAFWAEPAEIAEADADAEAPEPAPPPVRSSAAIADAAASPDRAPVTITPADDLPAAVRAALANLELLGVRSDTSGELFAMISVISSADRGSTVALGLHDEFIDDKHRDEAWRVEWIDARSDRVVLSRSGVNAELALWTRSELAIAARDPASDVAGPPVSITAASPEPAGVTVRRAAPDEIVAELRAAGVSEADVLSLTSELARRAEPELAGRPAEPPAAEQPQADPAQPPPGAAGLADLFRMMREVERTRRQGDERTDRAADPGEPGA